MERGYSGRKGKGWTKEEKWVQRMKKGKSKKEQKMRK